MPRVGDFYFCWKPVGVVLQCVTDFKQVAGLDSGQVIRWRSCHRWSALCLLACMYLAVTVALDRDSHAGLETGLIPVTIPEMLRMLRGTVIPPPLRARAHRQHWSQWRRRHQ